MKPINEKVFEIPEAQVVRKRLGQFLQMEKYLNAVKDLLQPRRNLDQLTERLCRDAGIDELLIERKKLARAPLIR